MGPSFLSCGPLCLQVMLQQRNAKMARALRHLEGKVVAVVGMAHLDGIEQLWQEQNDKVRQDRQVRHAASRATPVVLRRMPTIFAERSVQIKASLSSFSVTRTSSIVSMSSEHGSGNIWISDGLEWVASTLASPALFQFGTVHEWSVYQSCHTLHAGRSVSPNMFDCWEVHER